MELYEAMSTLRAVRRLRPDPIPEDSSPTGAHGRNVGADRRQSPAVADRRGEGCGEETGARRPVSPVLGWLTSSTTANTWRRCRRTNAHVGARDRRGHLSRYTHARSAGHRGVLLQPCDDDDHRQGSAATVGRRRRIGVSRGSEPAARVPQRRTGLRANDPALSRRAESARRCCELPEGWYTCAHVPIGYPVGGGHGRINRKPIEKMVFTDRFGNA